MLRYLSLFLAYSSTNSLLAIILCGGFGTNQYLFSELTTLCGPDMKVIQAKNPCVHMHSE